MCLCDGIFDYDIFIVSILNLNRNFEIHCATGYVLEVHRKQDQETLNFAGKKSPPIRSDSMITNLVDANR